MSDKVIEIVPGESVPEPEGPRRFSLAFVVLAVVVAFALGVLGALGATGKLDRSGQSPPDQAASTYTPRTDEERALFGNLRPATMSEAYAMTMLEAENHRFVQTIVYIALRDIRLPQMPLMSSVVIGLPQGKKWLSGPLNTIELVLWNERAGSLELGFRDGTLIYDPICSPTYRSQVRRACGSEGRRPSSQPALGGNLTRIDVLRDGTPLPLQSVSEYVGRSNVYIATGEVRLEPYYGANEGIPVIIMTSQAFVNGGTLGKVQLVSQELVPQIGRAWYAQTYDPVYMEVIERRKERVCPYLSAQVRSDFYPEAC